MISSVQVASRYLVRLRFDGAVVVSDSSEYVFQKFVETRPPSTTRGFLLSIRTNLRAGVGVHLCDDVSAFNSFLPSRVCMLCRGEGFRKRCFSSKWMFSFVWWCWVGSVGMYLALATGHGNVDETAGVLDALVGATLGGLLLLLGLNLDSKFSLG